MTDLAVGRKSCREEAMKALVTKNAKRNMGKLVPMMLQVAFSLVLWTLGGGMAIQAATTPTNEHRVVYNFAELPRSLTRCSRRHSRWSWSDGRSPRPFTHFTR